MLPIEKNKEYEIEIESVTSEGMGVGHIDGFCVFVPSTVDGDRVRALIVKVKTGYAYAKCVEVLRKSKYRKEPVCAAFSKCGGCQLMHIDYGKQLEIKKEIIENALKRIGGIDVKVSQMLGAENELRYRNKMIFPIGCDKNANKICGFYRERSHDIIPLDDCFLGDGINAKIIDTVMDFMEKYNISAYNEMSHTGIVRRLFIRKGFYTGEIMVVLSINAKVLPHCNELAESLSSLSPQIKSVILNFNTKRTNAVLGDKNTVIFGNETISDYLCSMKYEISPNSFYQINPQQTERLYNKAIELAEIDSNDNVMDLYCGIGTISLCAAKKAKHVVGVESVEQAVLNARKNAENNKIDNVTFYASQAEKIVPELVGQGYKPQVVILDPPRKGSDVVTLGAIVNASPDKIVYVSCNPATLARDLKFLADNGYRVKSVCGVDLFPQTVHVETCVLLSKLKSSKSVSIELDLDDLEITAAEAKATYGEIKEYILNKYGFKVSSLNIAQVKQESGIIERENFNKPSGKYRQPKCPEHKFNAIKETLEHFKMI